MVVKMFKKRLTKIAVFFICLPLFLFSVCCNLQQGRVDSTADSESISVSDTGVNSTSSSTNSGSQTSSDSGSDTSDTSGWVYNAEDGAYVQTVDFGDAFSVDNSSFYKKYSKEEKDLYYTLWEDSTLITVEVDITPQELYKIQKAYEDYCSTHNTAKIDTYRRCNLTITVNGAKYYYEEVGIRMRGNTSKRNFCTEDGTIYDYVHFRFDLTETFDGEDYAEGAWANDIYHEWTDDAARSVRKDRTFATMEKFYYKWNKNFDNTYVREVYASKMYAAFGLLMPHVTLCNFRIKQHGIMENFGVGSIYETVDKRFVKRNMEKSLQGGDLYKCCYVNSPANLTEARDYGVETPTQQFTYSLKTNNDRSAPDYHHNAHLKALISTLNSAKTGSADFKAKIESVVDMDYFTTFEAVNYLVGNPDCIRHNSNNYYLYFTPQGVGYLIPHDDDRCFGITMDWNPDNAALTREKPFDVYGPNGEVVNPLYRKTVLTGGDKYYRTVYADKLKYILETDWFTFAKFTKTYNTYAANYSALAQPSQNILNQVGNHIRTNLFYFDIGGNNIINSTSENTAVENYFTLKRQAAVSVL